MIDGVIKEKKIACLCYNKNNNKCFGGDEFMAERTECLWNNKLIGIESIYTVIDGKQINIEGAIEELRKRSRNKELFCPCGCGSNLILVAGEKQLREQHFRIDDENYNSACYYKNEGKVSAQSKVVLKCWLADKLGLQSIETRVPIFAVDDVNRKFEFSLLSRAKSVAISYHYERASLSDEKLKILDSNSKNIKVFYIVDKGNSLNNQQYPERLMKVQKRQGFCLLLEVSSINYDNAKIKAVFYAKDAYGLWKEIEFAEGLLKEFSINNDRDIVYKNVRLIDKLELAKNKFCDEYEQELLKIKKEQEQLEKQLIQQELERKKIEDAERRKKEELERQLSESIEKFPKAETVNYRNPNITLRVEKIKYEDFSRQDKRIVDEAGTRWAKCKHCGNIYPEEQLSSIGGLGELNYGTCYECYKRPQVAEEIKRGLKKQGSSICPICGGNLMERNGRFGKFIGCSNYPNCKYTERLKKS